MACQKSFLRAGVLLALDLILTLSAVAQQQMSNFDRERAQSMLQVVANDVRKNYYDPKLHGVDWDAKVRDAKEKIAKDTSFNMSMSPLLLFLIASTTPTYFSHLRSTLTSMTLAGEIRWLATTVSSFA